MAASNYDASLARVLKHEGGYSNHPSDPGGATKFGITIATYARFRGRSVTIADMRAMPLADAKAIYKASYWNALHCDELPAGLDYAVFDYGVNSGAGRAAKVLQRLLGLKANGKMTNAVVTRAAGESSTNLISRLCDERLAFLKSLKRWPVFGAGWSRRVAEVRRDAILMATNADTDKPIAVSEKERVSKPQVARNVTAGAIVVAGAGAAQAAYTWGASMPAMISMIVVIMTLAVASWIGWIFWHRRKRDASLPESVAQP